MIGKLLGLCAAAAFALTVASGLAQAQQKIRAGYIPVTEYLPAFIAQEKGFFRKHGIDVELVRVPLISNIPPALLAGDLQIGINTTTGFLQAVDGGLDLVIIAGAARIGEKGNTVSLVAAKDSGISKPKDLEGKKLAVSGLSSALDLLVRKWMIDRGVDVQKVNIVEVGFPLQSDALKSHQIDAAVVIEPFRGRMIEAGIASQLADFMPEVAANQIGNFWQATRAWASAHPKEIDEFRQALQDGIDFTRTDLEEAHQIEKKYLGMSSVVLPPMSLKVTTQDLQFYLDLCKQFGTVTGSPDLAPLIAK